MKYVVLGLIYGLEVLSPRKKGIAKLEAFQRRCIKQLQFLINKTSDTAALSIMRAHTVPVCVDTIRQSCRDQSSIENDIGLAVRRLAVRRIY